MSALVQNDSCFQNVISKAVSRTSRFHVLLLGAVIGILTAVPGDARVHRLNTDEVMIYKLFTSSPLQKREKTSLDPILCKVARDRAMDMARRGYYSHVNPDGQAANFLVQRAGFLLPPNYDGSKTGNNIESLVATTGGDSAYAFTFWINSKEHRKHVFAEDNFHKNQTSVGVGFFRSPQAPFTKYYVLICAPKNLSPRPPKWILKNPKGKIIAWTKGMVAKSGE